MNAKRSCPGVPKMYMTSESSTVMRPKSIATVVVTLAWTFDVSSTPFDSSVIAASVLSGGISETADTNVVLPTPKPPATTSFTEVMRRFTGRWLEGADTLDHPREGRELDLDRVAVGGLDTPGLDEIADEHHRDAERHTELGCHLGDRSGLPTELDGLGVLEVEMSGRITHRLDHRFHAKGIVTRACPAARDDERPHEVVPAGAVARHCSTLSFNSDTNAGLSTAPARCTSSCIWYPTPPTSQRRSATTPRELPSDTAATNRKPSSIATMTWSSAPSAKHRAVLSPRLVIPAMIAASCSAPARSSELDIAMRRPSDYTAIASVTPGVVSTKFDSIQLKLRTSWLTAFVGASCS